MTDTDLWERAEEAISESRRLAAAHRRILEQMTDIAVHRQIVARESERRVRAAEHSLVKGNAPHRRSGYSADSQT